MPFFRSLVEMLTDRQVLRESGEGVGAVVGDDHGVLDAHAAHTGEVHAGLDGHDVAGRQGTTRGRGDPRGLVDLEADAVPGAVHERVAPAGVVDDVAARLVDRRALDARAARRPARLLRVAARPRTTCRASGPGSPTLTVRVMSEQ